MARVKATPKKLTAISTVTVMEVEYGLQLNPARARKIEPVIRDLLQETVILPYERQDANATAAIRAALSKRSTPIGPYDIMIAGTAVRHGLVMVTSNGNEFKRIDGLLLEDWRE